MTGFELLDHTAEVGFRATGHTLAEAFEQAGRAVFQMMTDIDEIAADDDVQIQVESEDREALLYDFVDELIYLAETRRMVCAGFDLGIDETGDGYRLEGVGRGQRIQGTMRRQEVKAPTYSDIMVGQEDGTWTVQMFVDV